ncbi:MAG: hypothetical protein CMJ95_08065 [Planctomycetes bacterium]|nr:hypothetical protein [Planctomycetota bacterium]
MASGRREGMGDSMGTGTKIGIILILILVVVVIANLLDSEVQRGPSVEQQVTGKNANSAPAVRPVRPSATERRNTRPVQARSLATDDSSRRVVGDESSNLSETVSPPIGVPDGAVDIKPAVSRVSEVGVTRATGVIRTGGEISSPTGSSRPTPVLIPGAVEVVNKPEPAKLGTVTVQENDSLWAIASRQLGSGLRWTELLEVNPGLREDTILQPGQLLKIPANNVAVKRPVARVLRPVSVRAGFRSVVIREGDTLYDLAEQQLGSGLRWSEIQDANPGLNPNRLPVGKKILIPR